MSEKILCTIDDFAPEARKILAGLGEVTVAVPTQAELPKAASGATILVIQLGLKIDKAVMDCAPGLKAIATATTGIDHIDATEAEARGITIVSLRNETEFLRTITATAELACGLMIALARSIPAAHRSVLEGKWWRSRFCGHSLYGKTLGIIGKGRLGEMMETYGKTLGMNVVFTDPAVRGGIELEELLKSSDVVSLHVHLLPETEGMIGTERLKMMKPSAILINTARGKLVDEAALLKALEAGQIAGYAADVLGDELSFTPDEAKSSLIDYARTHDNVILTPHIGGTTQEARSATDVFIATKLRDELSLNTVSP